MYLFIFTARTKTNNKKNNNNNNQSKYEDQDMIKSLAEPLPLAHSHHTVEDEELLNYVPKTPSYVSRDEMDRVWPQSPGSITVAPQLDDCAVSEELLRSCSTKRRADKIRPREQASTLALVKSELNCPEKNENCFHFNKFVRLCNERLS